MTDHGVAAAGAAERQVEHGAQVLLELAGRRSVHRPVAAVVRAHGELVDEEAVVGRLEQLDGEHAGDAEARRRSSIAIVGRDVGELAGRSRAGRDDLAAHAADLHASRRRGQAAISPDGRRATSCASSRRKSTSSSTSSAPPRPSSAIVANQSATSAAARTTRTPLPS